jgi:peptidoglycan hydrolase-like protein with peptidoglycan-binding domain
MLRKSFLTLSAVFLFAAFGAAQEKTASTTDSAKTTAETKSKPASFRPTKSQIEKVQTMLKEKKLYSGEADGKYNDDTSTGIKKFQKDNGLKETGRLNVETLDKMGIDATKSQKGMSISETSDAKSTDSKSAAKTEGPSAKTTPEGPKRPAPFRANADQIKTVQKMLKDGKMYAGDETGKLDDPTRDGLKKYQEANSLKVTGTLNAATLQKMGVALTDKQKEQVTAQAAYDAAKKN